MVSAGLVGGTCGSGIVSSAPDVHWKSVVRVMRGVGGVCEMCVFGSERRGWKGGERIGFGLYQSCRNRGSVGRVFGLRWCGWCRCGVGMCLDQGLEGGVLLCLCGL